MIIKYARSKPNKETFQIPPIKKLMKKYVGFAYLDVFPYPFNMDALAMLKTFDDNSVKHLVLDPPYSERQLSESYKQLGAFSIQGKPKYWSDVKDEVMRVCQVGGIVVTMGWNSVGMGLSRNFIKKEILLVCHGAQHNDTIVTVERKGPVLAV